jgi:predicted dehydrogenase
MSRGTPYESLVGIGSMKFDDRTVLLIGAGWMARQYALALSQMNIKNVTILSRSQEGAARLSHEFGFKTLSSGYERHIPSITRKDLVIVATPIHLLLPAAIKALKNGQRNILVEKPGSLYYQELQSLVRNLRGQRVRVAYNRLLYPNMHRLKELLKKEGGATSCTFTFTEWVHTIDFKKERRDAYLRWGISNSLHVIAMAFEIIGMPRRIDARQYGTLRWHPSGSIFVGSGESEQGVPFSYHADWNSAGRWGIEVMTKENSYRLMPLEDLQVCKKGSVNWEKVPFDTAFDTLKNGVGEEVAVMLDRRLEAAAGSVSLSKAAAFNKIGEKIFGYA